MAKLYDFRFVVRKAENTGTGHAIHYGGADTVYREECRQMSVADAKAHVQAMSDAEPRTHVAVCSMKYSDARRAPGLGAGAGKWGWVYGGAK